MKDEEEDEEEEEEEEESCSRGSFRRMRKMREKE